MSNGFSHLEKCVFFLYASKSFGLILPEESSMACERRLRGRCGASPVDPSSVMLPLDLVRPTPKPVLDARRPFARKSETLFMIIVPPPTVMPRRRSPSIDAPSPAQVREAAVPHFALLIWTDRQTDRGPAEERVGRGKRRGEGGLQLQH